MNFGDIQIGQLTKLCNLWVNGKWRWQSEYQVDASGHVSGSSGTIMLMGV